MLKFLKRNKAGMVDGVLKKRNFNGLPKVKMYDNLQKSSSSRFSTSHTRLLDPSQVEMIEEVLASLGEFGEVRLVVEKSRLRYLVTQKSFDAQKWRPGVITLNGE